MKAISLLAALVASVDGAVLWDGRFNEFTSSSDLLNWSWANQVGPYRTSTPSCTIHGKKKRKYNPLTQPPSAEYYIHGSGSVQSYINLSPDYKNPADTSSEQGAKFTLDRTAFWNGQNMRRTELIPQTKAAVNRGKVFYHFSMMRKDTNAPSVNREHQICFFESHFTEMKYGWISGEQGASNPNLQWMTNQQSRWKTEWKAGVWHNIAYEIVSLRGRELAGCLLGLFKGRGVVEQGFA
jgi:hypothetical protein